jgi:hypothetical protein
MQKDIFGECRYKVGLHIHTSVTDGKLSSKEAAKIYKSAGFDAVAFTDHWVYGEETEIDGLKIISGCEYNLGSSDTSIDVIHIVGVGMNKDPEIVRSTATRQGVVDSIKENGGIAIWAHPAWSLNSLNDTKTVCGFDAVEIYNTVSNVCQSSRPYSGYFVDVLANNGIVYPLIATDDTHYYNGEDETRSYIMVKAPSNSQADIVSAILRKDFYATQGPELHIKREGDIVVVDCSPCAMINFLSNIAWAPDRIIKGENLTHAEYRIKDCEKWIRAEVLDKDGNYAWSNIIEIE